MALPCTHQERITRQVQPTIELLRNLDEWHPDVLLKHDIQPRDYNGSLVFRSAVESIRGRFIASSTSSREGFIGSILENLSQRDRIAGYKKSGGTHRHDFEVALARDPDYFAALEVKGGEGNSVNISERPLWAREFGVWCHLDGAIVNEPAHGAKAILNRLTNELVLRQKQVDVLFFKDTLCGTALRPCPKYPDRPDRIGEAVAPDVFLFPQRVPGDSEPEPPVHTLETLRLPRLVLDLFGVEEEAIGRHLWQVHVRFLRSRTGRPTREVEIFHLRTTRCHRRLTRWKQAQERVMSGAVQLSMFNEDDSVDELDARLWHGCFNARESSFHQLSPYVGKLKSGMVRVLVHLYSKAGDTVLDPFSGSGVVPLEAVLAERRALANDLSPYAYVLTRGKLDAPRNEKQALEQAKAVIEKVEKEAPNEDLRHVPEWVREFFHPQTLPEIMAAFRILKKEENFFLTACLLGILHHQRPGFLSYPASHLVPYLRKTKYPPEEYPEMYVYRDLRSRLLAKVKRAYRNIMWPTSWEIREYQVWQTNAMNLPIKKGSVDAIISSPPYFGALDYARDNRLRLWFLGCENWKELDTSLTASQKVYIPQMSACLKEMDRVLKPSGYCVLVLGDVERDGQNKRTAEILGELATEVSKSRFVVETIYDDCIPDERRSRRRTRTTKFERILVMQKI